MRTILVVVLAGLAGAATPLLGQRQPEAAPRTFPQFAGTWVLDETASTGRLSIAPRIARELTITTAPEAITLNQLLRLNPSDDPAREKAPADVYRFDGRETMIPEGRGLRFTLVADALALTTTRYAQRSGDNTSIVTDALSVDGDVLTLHRQLSAVLMPAGHIATMQAPDNNYRHTYIYRRGAAGSGSP